MKRILDICCDTYGCGYLHDLEFKRTAAFPKGTGISSIRRSLFLQCLFPSPVGAVDQGPYPVVVFVPGGAWRSPQVRFRIPFLVPLALRGILVFMVEYRGCELFSCEDATADVRSAIRYVRAHAAEYGGDPNNIFLMGESAGAHLAMLAAYGGSRFDDPTDDMNVSANINGILDLYGPTDCGGEVAAEHFKSLPDEKALAHPMAILTRGYVRSQFFHRLEAISPLRYVSNDSPPTLIAHGEKDQIVSIRHADALHDSLMAEDLPVEYYCVQGATHGDWRFYETVMMNRYAAFIRAHTQKRPD